MPVEGEVRSFGGEKRQMSTFGNQEVCNESLKLFYNEGFTKENFAPNKRFMSALKSASNGCSVVWSGDICLEEVTSKQCEDPASIQLELYWGEIASSDTHSNYVLEQSNNSVQVGASTKDAPQVESSVAKRGDILIDINNRFPRDFLSDIFSKERLTEESSSISPLYSDGTKHWSFFQKLAHDEFVRNDVSLMDQDHLGYSSPLTKLTKRVLEPIIFHS
ncbi:hypothetical protein IFM89_028201 [Coptis chinensis]|uniref:Uncharacterized protein n=1 Tax=Coptis chinensis TaxID=261450 RepID=A0A835HFT2_9MAGN|nr:hypothetical protein IFM89_028201 [Coptis chinensis]